MSIQKGDPAAKVSLFLMADAVGCAVPDQKTAQGYYNIEPMLKAVINKGGMVKCCGTCLEARGLRSVPMIAGAEKSTMKELTDLTLSADKVLTF